MSRFKKLWRPELFSALGAGFQNDATVNDGIHLRWILHSLMGLPHQFEDGPVSQKNSHGHTEIYVSRTSERSINDANLFERGTPYRPLSVLTPDARGRMLPAGGKFKFIKSHRQEFMQAYRQLSIYTDLLRSRMLTYPDGAAEGKKLGREFLTYMEEVLEKLKPGLGFGNWAYGEVCAVDLQFAAQKASGTTGAGQVEESRRWHAALFPSSSVDRPVVDPNLLQRLALDPTLLERPIFDPRDPVRPPVVRGGGNVVAAPFPFPGRRLPTLIKNKVWYRIKAYDRHDRLVDQDWIGQYGLSPAGAVGNRTVGTTSHKLYAKLRAPGIDYLIFEVVQEQTDFVFRDLRYVFCEDFCQDDKLWSRFDRESHLFRSFPDHYTPSSVRDKYYAPFRKNVDPGFATQHIRDRFVTDTHTQAMLDDGYSFDMHRHRTQFPGGDGSDLAVPTQSALLSASTEPLLANLLGLYYFADARNPQMEDLNGRDFMVVSHLPFFQPRNLERIEALFAQYLYPNTNADLFRLENSDLEGARLCGLVLGPKVGPKPGPHLAEQFDTKVHVTDLPSPTVPGSANLFVQAKLTLPYDSRENLDLVKPWLQPVSFELLRRLSAGPLVNVIEADDSDPDPLDEIGIVPPVYFPRAEDKTPTHLMLRDSFAIPAIQSESLTYALRTFDIFGRPSATVNGQPREIALPCYPPSAPTSVGMEVRTMGGQVRTALQFSLDTNTSALQARVQTLEIDIHDLPATGDQPPENFQWAGTRHARRIAYQYDTATRQLVPGSQSVSCVALSWSGNQLQRSGAAESACSGFPPAAPTLTPIDPPNLSFAETGYRSFVLRLPVGAVAQMGPGNYRYAARLRVRGECPHSGAARYSEEVVVAQLIAITPPPPPVQQPPLVAIPVSTHPDTRGDAYYMLDLHEFISAAELANKPMVNVYQTTLDKLEDGLILVDGPDLLDQSAFINLARGSRTRFELRTPKPVEVSATGRYFPIKVAGDLQQYHVVTVLGTNQLLEENSWPQAGVTLFRTPAPAPEPALSFLSAKPSVITGDNGIILRYGAVFTGALPDPAHPPRLQVVRRDLSTLAAAPPVYVGTVVGALATAVPGGGMHYHFELQDAPLHNWRRFGYESYLLRYDALRGQYLKTKQSARHEVLAGWNFLTDPILPPDAFSVSGPLGDRKVVADFSPGDFAFSLVKIREDGSPVRYVGQIRAGTLSGPTAARATLAPTVAGGYRLTITDDDASEGEYTLRLRFGQYTWSKKLVP